MVVVFLDRRVKKMGAVYVSNWLVIFTNDEFVVKAETLIDARKAVEREARARGLKHRRDYDIYRLGGSAYAEE